MSFGWKTQPEDRVHGAATTKVCFLWTAFVLFIAGCSSREHGPNQATPASPQVGISSAEILDKGQGLAKWVEVRRDPVFEAPKTFRAIPLAELLQRLGHTNAALEIHIRCRDGFMASLSSTEALDGTGFLALADESGTNVSDGTTFSLLKTKSGLIDPGPLYLFWKDDAGNRPRPYQIEEIEFCPTGETLARAKPIGSASAQRGFELFKKNCSSCHAVNGAGGRLAVDLNFPMNVTEYWKKSVLKKLISDPMSIRANAKMPAFPQLTEANVKDIVSYLERMREQKLVR
jgi:mono/diheme cytochrome c family protein